MSFLNFPHSSPTFQKLPKLSRTFQNFSEFKETYPKQMETQTAYKMVRKGSSRAYNMSLRISRHADSMDDDSGASVAPEHFDIGPNKFCNRS